MVLDALEDKENAHVVYTDFEKCSHGEIVHKMRTKKKKGVNGKVIR